MKEYIDAIKTIIKNRPEWSKGQQFVIMSGRETLAEYSASTKILKVKTGRCTGCGECCLALEPNSKADIHWGTDDEGKCKKLYQDGAMWRCGAGVDMPWKCLLDPSLNTPTCEMEFHEEEF